MPFARTETKLGAEFYPFLQQVLDLVVGRTDAELDVWTRLDRAFELLVCSDLSAECRDLEAACAAAMIAAGVDPKWVEADYGNVGELLAGKLGPVP